MAEFRDEMAFTRWVSAVECISGVGSVLPANSEADRPSIEWSRKSYYLIVRFPKMEDRSVILIGGYNAVPLMTRTDRTHLMSNIRNVMPPNFVVSNRLERVRALNKDIKQSKILHRKYRRHESVHDMR